MKYIESPYFRYIIEPNTFSAGEEKLIDFRKDTKADDRYLPFNYLVIKNLSSIDIEVIIDDNKQADPILIPAGTVITIENEVFEKLRLKNISIVSNDRPIYIEAKREIKEIDILKEILKMLGGKVKLSY